MALIAIATPALSASWLRAPKLRREFLSFDQAGSIGFMSGE